ncbi:Radical_SAM domain containing protein [uncultured Caudovirales phage]|uniref:Radical_SAM domain containing protein n=1 Tax=uncultured Caudovirales phage TaxID=2100421 RepID=A0A6J5L9Z4_9CAUD|nr:Radical_SAM domain containing protein [uncultured Caudovirales phage]CAB4135173.1 Radical_SAM domain containing protein [uncultured Caudovirales phage]
MSNDLESFVAASKFPWKVISQHHKIFQNGKIIPYHIQFIPTNRCNAKCEWCSCSKVDRAIEMSYEESLDMLQYFHELGTKAITITGGGEPSIHPNIKNIIETCASLGIKVGVVTNGLKWNRDPDIDYLNRAVTWMRLSIIDTIGRTGNYDIGILTRLAAKLPNVALGVSFTVASEVNLTTAIQICDEAETLPNVTHIRFVQDILNPNYETMNMIQGVCGGSNKAIFQFRSEFTKGNKDCRISLLKPVIDASGYVFPCCGVQYATSDTNRMPESFRMCRWQDFHKINHFNGTRCFKCYYNDYNDALAHLSNKLEHEEFV